MRTGEGGLATCPQPLAAEEAILGLRAGGNAVDAAVRGAFVQMVVDPLMGSPGGMGQALVWLAPSERARVTSHDPRFLDEVTSLSQGRPAELSFHSRAGAKASPDMWADKILGRSPLWAQYLLDGHVNDVGYGAIMTPGVVAGLWELHTRLGRRPWQECVRPAIDLALEGFPMTPSLYTSLTAPTVKGAPPSWETRIKMFPATAKTFSGADGEFAVVGEMLANPDLARVLTQIADGGAEEFYRGELAGRMTADLSAHGSTITADDFATYEPRWTNPIRGAYRGREVFTITPPGGGVTILQILGILEQLEACGLDPWSPEAADMFAFAARAAFADRDIYVGDSQFVDVPVGWLVSAERSQYWAEIFRKDGEIEVPDWAQAGVGDTTHISVVDEEGNAVALTQTIGSHSGVTTPGLGFGWNNCLYLADPAPGHPNSITPGKARLTGMSPTMLFHEGELEMVVGAPGGTTIVTGIAQTVRNAIGYGMTATEAVTFPRLHAEGTSVYLEGRFERQVRRRLESRGLEVVHGPGGMARGQTSLATAILRRAQRGAGPWLSRHWDPGSDPRGDGGTAWE